MFLKRQSLLTDVLKKNERLAAKFNSRLIQEVEKFYESFSAAACTVRNFGGSTERRKIMLYFYFLQLCLNELLKDWFTRKYLREFLKKRIGNFFQWIVSCASCCVQKTLSKIPDRTRLSPA